ncbi:2-hydroxychromene-2-carboxylate isomerase [Vibrio caribbeanicus]|uniref:2-hydroxychromene-2-carboxylate isomerase n=1 Tax=Vibrio caribbeanicus TaxID=701175 RepID=UPI0030D71679
MSQPITAWLSIGSTYSYLTAMRIRELVTKENLDLTIKPISIRRIMQEMDNIPFPSSKQPKVDYMWRDIQRRARRYHLPIPNVPVTYPLNYFDQANLVGVVVNQQGRYLEYFETIYRLWFLEGIEAGSPESLHLTLKKLNLDVELILNEADKETSLTVYRANTEAAKRMGIFGVPSFTVENEIFWGDDRLEDTIDYASSND